MVTRYEREGHDFWWVDFGTKRDCRRTHVGSIYRGPNLDNYHYFVRCRPIQPEDLDILEVTGVVHAAPSNKPNTMWSEVLPGDSAAPGTVLRLDPGATLVWRRSAPAEKTGKLSAVDEQVKFQVEATELTPLTKKPASVETD